MELKPDKLSSIMFSPKLLIVPYGIETRSQTQHFRFRPTLLIVPYGIETIFAAKSFFRIFFF